MSKRLIGKCGICGGAVYLDTVYMSTKPPKPRCESCGAVADETANMPVIPMKGMRKQRIQPSGSMSDWIHETMSVPSKGI